MTRNDSGFYVMLQPKKSNFDPHNIDWNNIQDHAEIIGQSYAWISIAGNLVLDSFETQREEGVEKFYIKILTNFASKAIASNPNIHKTNIGFRLSQQLIVNH